MRAALYSDRPSELFEAEAIRHPERLYARLRRESPIARVAETGVHLVSTWNLIDEALGREADFSAHLTGILIRGEDGLPSLFEIPVNPASQVIATADEPEHAVHRAITQPRLAAPMVAALEAPIRLWAREAITEFVENGGGDFVPVAERIPALVVAHLLGLPDGDVSRHRAWAMMGGDMLAGDVDQAKITHFAGETLRMAKYLGDHLERARNRPETGPGAPLLHALGRAVDEGRISAEEAIGIAIVMFGAGGESTAGLIGSAARKLAESPKLAQRLRDEPALVARFVEEVARLEGPFKFHYRAVTRPCELGGADLAVGDRLMLLWASANRDAAHFEAPDELRLDRKNPKRHLSFGRGGHFCIGAPAARLEARVVCEQLLRATSQIGLAAAPVYANSIFVRRLESLTLSVTC